MPSSRLVPLMLALASGALAQSPTDPFPAPIAATAGVIRVRVADFASVPEVGGDAARMMLLVDEPGTRRLFVNDMRGLLYTVGYDGRTVTPYLDVNARTWGVPVQSMGRERGFQSFAIHPQFGQAGAPGFGKLYAYGVRNPQRFGWDPQNGNLFLADIGQNIVEELSLVRPGANLGWNRWEGSFGYISREAVDLARRRADPAVTYPVVEYGQLDPLFQENSAITGIHVYRVDAIPELANLVLFGDFPSGEIFYIHADMLPHGGQDAIRRVLLDDGTGPKTLLQLIREKNARQGKPPAARADLRFGAARDGRVFLLNKHDGTIRLLVPDGASSR